MSPTPASVAFFDLDDTITVENTGKLLVQYLYETGAMSRRDVVRAALLDVQFRWGLRSYGDIAADAALFNRGAPVAELEHQISNWFAATGQAAISPLAREWAEQHRQRGDLLVINTSGTRFNSAPFVQDLEFDDVLCTELEVADGRFTGGLLPPVCFGKGKLIKAQDFCRVRAIELDDCTFYSDSHHDLPLFLEVGTPIAVNPTLQLFMEARKRGWEIRLTRPSWWRRPCPAIPNAIVERSA